MKKFRALLGIFLLVAIMVSLFSSASPVGAATTKSITVSIYKSPKVTNSNSTLKSYVTNAVNTISGTSSATNLDLTIYGPYLKSAWTDCYGGSGPKIKGNLGQRYLTVSFFKYQLRTNGYALQHDGWAQVDIDPNGWGATTCDGRIIANWGDQKATTHEMSHIFDAEDTCLYACGAMDKCCGINGDTLVGDQADLVKDYLDNKW